jgi:hypothetical protein
VLLGVIAIVPSALAGPASAPASATRAQVFRAFTPAGHPMLTVTVRRRGSCFSGSIATPRRDAWRCMSGNEIFDPCFSSSAAHGVVVCPALNLTTGAQLRLTKPLPRRYANHRRPSLRLEPWELELTHGRRCRIITGATTVVGGKRLNYGCTGGISLWGLPSRRTPHWTILSGSPSTHHLHARQMIVRAWM